MSVLTITYAARCKDCKFLIDDPKHKRWHICGNPESPKHTQGRTLRDLVCDNWKYLYEK